MGEEEEQALFNQNVRSVIRKCALSMAPVWVPIIAAFGWWLVDLSSNVGYNTKSLAKQEVKIDYLVSHAKGEK